MEQLLGQNDTKNLTITEMISISNEALTDLLEMKKRHLEDILSLMGKYNYETLDCLNTIPFLKAKEKLEKSDLSDCEKKNLIDKVSYKFQCIYDYIFTYKYVPETLKKDIKNIENNLNK